MQSTKVILDQKSRYSFIKTILRNVKIRLKKFRMPKPPYPVRKLKKLERLGSDYGGWVIPRNFLNAQSICYLAGAGEDISFDVDIAEKYDSQVYIFDPTPRSKVHFEELINNVSKGEPMMIGHLPNQFYNIQKENLDKLHFFDLGIWKQEEEMKFYSPKDKAHVSHSIMNLQKTSDYFIAKVKRLSQILLELGHEELDLLKLDIEGAEYDVIESIIEDKLSIKVICVEFDEVHNSLDGKHWDRILKSMKAIADYGYEIVHMDEFYNTTFIRKDIYQELKNAR